MSAVPTYEGPSCQTCCDLRPGQQWATRQDYVNNPDRRSLSLSLFVETLVKSALNCSQCEVLVDAIEQIEGKPIGAVTFSDEGIMHAYGKLGQPLEVNYGVDDQELNRSIEIFTLTDTSGWTFEERNAGAQADPQKDNVLGPGSRVLETIKPSIAAQKARVCLDVCQTHHDGCSFSLDSLLPTRVVCVGPQEDSLRLHECEPGDKASYVALSYCWGKSQPLTTTKQNYQSMLTGISWETVPKTLQDAIEFTRALGVSYIWIDALCIIQDDANDWELEAAKMKAIYEHALVTLSATSAPDVGTGCFMPRNKPSLPLKIPGLFVRHSCRETHTNLFLYAQDGNGIDFAEYPAMARGWIFQERLLSPRVLYAAHDELIWECRSGITCECAAFDMHKKKGLNAVTSYKQQHWLTEDIHASYGDDPKAAASGAVSMWLDLLAAYTHRDFGFYSDRLVALSGIAQKFQDINRLGKYYAGLWEFALTSQLAWARWPSPRARESVRIGGPTWSWASINQPCAFVEFHPVSSLRSRVEIWDCKVSLRTADPTGAVDSGRLRVSAPAFEGKLAMTHKKKNMVQDYMTMYAGMAQKDRLEVSVEVGGRSYLMIADIPQWDDTSPTKQLMQPEEILEPGETVLCAELFETIAEQNRPPARATVSYRCPFLVLKWSSLNQAYRRVGLIDFSNRLDFKKEDQDREFLRPFERMRTMVIE